MLKFLKYLIIFAIILTFGAIGIVIFEISNSNDSNTLLALAGMLIGLASFAVMAAIRYSDIIRSQKSDEDFTSINKRLEEIERSIAEIKISTTSKSNITNTVEVTIPLRKKPLLTLKFTSKEDPTNS